MAINVDEIGYWAEAYQENDLHPDRNNEDSIRATVAEFDTALSHSYGTIVCPSLLIMLRGWLSRKHLGGKCTGHDEGYTTPCILCRNSGHAGTCWLNLYSSIVELWWNGWFTADEDESQTYWEYRAASALSRGMELECRFAVWAWWWLGLPQEGVAWNQAAVVERYHAILRGRERIEAEDRRRTAEHRRAYDARKKASR